MTTITAPKRRQPTILSEFQRLQKKATVDLATGCVVMNSKHLNKKGYGRFQTPLTKGSRAHRTLWQLFYGPIEEGMVIHHACHNRACVNLHHLRKVTWKQNAQDRTITSKNSTGVRNVHRSGEKFYVAVETNCKIYRVYNIPTLEEAMEVAANLRNEHHYKTEGF